MESDLSERERSLRRRSADLDAVEARLAARIREQNQREGRALDSVVNETLEQGRALLLRDEQQTIRPQGDVNILAHADEIAATSIASSRYSASRFGVRHERGRARD